MFIGFCWFVCFLLSARPPSSTRTVTLCPYTTLCRSVGDHRQRLQVCAAVAVHDALGAPRGAARVVQRQQRHLVGWRCAGVRGGGELHLVRVARPAAHRTEEHTYELPSLMRTSYDAYCS